MNRTAPIARLAVVATLFTLSVSGCATAYQSKRLSGGFEETRLGDGMYQVRFQGNGYTSQDRASQFLLRRCAELTLEHGQRYFALGGVDRQTSMSAGSGMLFSFPHGQAIFRVLEDKATDPMAIDAVVVVEDTDALAEGVLSAKAKETLQGLKAAPPG